MQVVFSTQEAYGFNSSKQDAFQFHPSPFTTKLFIRENPIKFFEKPMKR